jgi:protein-tyrosine-phosphatase
MGPKTHLPQTGLTILFIGNGNVARSQLAAAYLTSLRPDLTAQSAGIEVTVGKPLNPDVLRVAREDHLDLALAYRKEITLGMLGDADYIISFVEESRLPHGVRVDAYWPVPDPRGQAYGIFQAVRYDIKARVGALAHAIT